MCPVSSLDGDILASTMEANFMCNVSFRPSHAAPAKLKECRLKPKPVIAGPLVSLLQDTKFAGAALDSAHIGSVLTPAKNLCSSPTKCILFRKYEADRL